MWFGCRFNLPKLGKLDASIKLRSVVIEPLHSVRDLRVILDGELSMIQRIGKISSICILSTSVDYVNSGLYWTRHLCNMWYRRSSCRAWITVTPCSLASQPAHLRLSNVYLMPRLALYSVPRHVTDIMRSLHWQPIEYRIRYKLWLLMQPSKMALARPTSWT